jgi:hypothetical protein
MKNSDYPRNLKKVATPHTIVKKLAPLPLLLILLLIPAVHAATPVSVSGDYSNTFTVLSVTSEGPNVIIFGTDVFVLTGGISGTCTGSDTAVLLPNGLETFHGTCSFSGTVAGSASGTASVTLTGTSFGPTYFVFVQGTGGLAGIQVQGFAPNTCASCYVATITDT